MPIIDEIALHNVLPYIFRDKADKSLSGIWSTDVTFKRGLRYLIRAESGAGKSSLCSYIYGNRCDYSGCILFDGRDISTFKISEWCNLRMESLAMLPQEMRIFPELTSLENILVKNNLTSYKSKKDIMTMLERLGLEDKVNEPASHLSIGQQQRLAIIRTLCQPMDFLLIDEPVSHLDSHNNNVAAQLIDEETKRQGAAVIATSVGNDIKLDFNLTLSM